MTAAFLERGTTLAASPILSAPARTTYSGDGRDLIAVYRATQVLTTAAMQMPLTVERDGHRLSKLPSLIAAPDPYMPQSQWVAHMVASMALTGNAYALALRAPDDTLIALRPVDPRRVFVTVNTTTGVPRYSYDGRELSGRDILHAHLQPATPSEPLGLGPVQAARREINGARDVRDYASQWFDGTGQPTGILSSPNATYAQALATRNAWNGLDEQGNKIQDGTNPSGVKVLPSGFSYTPLAISPRDAQWIEAQNYNTVQIMRLFGIPSSLMYASPEGVSLTYSNVQDEWLSFIRFTLMAYLRPLEDALTAKTVRGQVVRFNLDALLRPSTKARYDAHAVAISSGFLTVDEVRELEGLQPLTTPATCEA